MGSVLYLLQGPLLEILWLCLTYCLSQETINVVVESKQSRNFEVVCLCDICAGCWIWVYVWFCLLCSVVTGCTGGLGEEFCMRFAEQGLNVVLVSRCSISIDALRSKIGQWCIIYSQQLAINLHKRFHSCVHLVYFMFASRCVSV